MTGTDLARVPQHTLAELQGIAKAFAASGYFKDATDVAKAYTKVVAGQELGIGPMQAITQIHVVQGKPTLSAGLVGAMIKRSGRYNYRVEKLTDAVCVLTFTEDGKDAGPSEFSIEDAEKAGLLKNPTWRNYPRNMLLSRALTNGARWYCPDVFGGAVYTPDELGAEVDGETGELQEQPARTGRIVHGDLPVPSDDEPVVLEETLEAEAAEVGAEVVDVQDEPLPDEPTISDAQRRLLHAKKKEAGMGDADLKNLVYALTQKTSTSGLTKPELDQILAAIGEWTPEEAA